MDFAIQRRDDAPDPIDLYVGRRVRQLRKNRKLTQTELGTLIGVSFQQIQKYERGTNRISVSMLFRIARGLHTPLGDFFAGLPETGRAANDLDTDLAAQSPDLGLIDAALRMAPEVRDSFMALARSLATPPRSAPISPASRMGEDA